MAKASGHEGCDWCCDLCGEWANECTCNPKCIEKESDETQIQELDHHAHC